MTGGNVLPRVAPRTEEQFRARVLQGLYRLIAVHGEAQVALWMGMSVRHLGTNVLRGDSLPSAWRIWNLLAWDASAHDELDRDFDLKNVAHGAICASDPLTLDLIALAHEAAEDEALDSPGGVATTDHELLEKNEPRLRKVHARIGHWLDRLDRLRRRPE